MRAVCLFKINLLGTIIENPSFYSDIRRFGWPSYTSAVVINVWLCCLTGYVLRRRKNNVLIMEVRKSIVAVRQLDVLKAVFGDREA